MDRETVPNSDWMNELRRLAVEEWGFTREQADNSMPVNWSRYYVEGLTPRQTLEEAFADDR